MEGSSKSSNQRRVRRSREEWGSVVSRFEESGQTRGAVCAETGISVSTLRRWCSRLRQRPPAGVSQAPVFVELPGEQNKAEASVPSWEVELQLGAGVVLRLRQV